MTQALPQTPVFTPDPYNSANLIARLWREYLRPYAGLILLTFAVMMIEGSTLGILSYLIEPLFDKVFIPGGGDALVSIGLAILGLFCLRGVTSVLSKYLMTLISNGSAATIQKTMLRHILTLDGSFFHQNAPGALIDRVQGDTAAVQGIWACVISGLGRDGVALISLGIVAISIDPIWTLAAMIGTPLLVLPALLLQKYIRKKTGHMRHQSGLRASRLDEVFHGINTVKLYQMEDYQTAQFSTIVQKIINAELKMALGNSGLPALIDIVTGVGFFAVLLVGGREVIDGTRTTGEFMAFFTAMSLTFQPLRRLGALSGSWQTAAASLERVYRLLDTEPKYRATIPNPKPKKGSAAIINEAPEIRFDNVSFLYGENPILCALNLCAPAGKLTALVGASGAGKSTIFHLLTGLIAPQNGHIYIGKTDIEALSKQDLRSHFSVVSQDSAIFDESLIENIVLGQNFSKSVLDNALDAAYVSEFLGSMPDGLASHAGPRGSALSGGQRQRLAIARALLRDAPILLLDEATSALDAQSETYVASALGKLREGRTTLIIAHSLATVRNADLILVMDKGQIVEQGTHETLLAQCGLYETLCRLQFSV
ncbi:MAG: subfamily B ATP-binding cassette protein MsbA [Paracoccaceae bacterium]